MTSAGGGPSVSSFSRRPRNTTPRGTMNQHSYASSVDPTGVYGSHSRTCTTPADCPGVRGLPPSKMEQCFLHVSAAEA